MNTGERWAHRRLRAEELSEVEILSIGTKIPARIKVRFIADRFEGAVEWVPPSRLKSPWSERFTYEAAVDAWAALRQTTLSSTDTEQEAVNYVFRLLLPRYIAEAERHASDDGLTRVHDWPSLEALVGLDRRDLIGVGSVIVDDGTVIGWTGTLAIARALAAKEPGRVLDDAAAMERDVRYEAAHGVRFYNGRLERGNSAMAAELMDRSFGPLFAMLRDWAGADSRPDILEIDELRQRALWLTDLLNLTVDALRDTSNEINPEDEAWKLHKALYATSRRTPDWTLANSIRDARKPAIWPHFGHE